jgi:hypothetical protein
LILSLNLTVNALSASTEEVLVDAVYKLIHRVNYLEEKLQELQSRCQCLGVQNTRDTGNTKDTGGLRPERLRVIIGTFRSRRGAERFVREYKSKIPACINIRETTCRNWKCFVVYTNVSMEEYRKIKVLIPDAFISRTTLRLRTGAEQGFPTATQTTGVQD